MGCVYSRACIGEVCAPREQRIKQQHQQQILQQTRGHARGAGGHARGAEFPVYSPQLSSPDSEGRDQINQLNSSAEPELGIARLARVSSQFLPPSGSRNVKVPAANYELRYSYLSQRGFYPDALDKANQDSFCIHTPFGTSANDNFFGVFDGHGEFGAQCSQFVKRKLCENLLRNSKFNVDAVEACHSAFLTTNSQLHADSLDDSMSGTTAITVLVRGKTLYVANTGDSRAVLAERRGKEIAAIDLSNDQTPFRADEIERVKLCGARVLTLDQIEGLKNPDVQCWGTEEQDDGDPPRLWVPNGMYPGTAFTRSIGDSIAETIGVVANPEIAVLELTPQHPFFVIASDGVFEFLSSQTVVEMVAKYGDPRDACAAIVAESYRLWLQYETRTDDITVIVVHIDGLTNDVVGESTSPGTVLTAPTPQVVEVTGKESPSTFSWNSQNQRVRHDLSRARLRAIESSLENGKVWIPPSPAHRKTWEEEAQIERALQDHFLFKKLTDSQCQVLLDCMQRVEVQPGEVVVKQGGEGDCFYVVGSGEFEVYATQEEVNGEVPKVLQRYTADKLSSFGELALMYNKPLQASVRAVTGGTLWALKREDFRGILMSEFSNLLSLKLLRSVDLLSRLTILQLSRIADSLAEVSFLDGQTIVNGNEAPPALYIIQRGRVRLTFDADVFSNTNVGSLNIENQNEDNSYLSGKRLSLEKTEGDYFGEWALLGEDVGSLSAVAVGDCTCSILTKEKFDSVVGPLTKLSHDAEKSRCSSADFSKESIGNADTILALPKVRLCDLEWKTCLYSTDCSEIGLVLLKDSANLYSLKRFSKEKIKKLGKEAQVLKEKNLMKSMSPSACVPQVLCTCADRMHAGILLNVCLACPLASILHTALDEPSARFCAASVVIALEDLHQNGILYRGVSPDVLMLDQTGHLQLVDFRFAKKLSGDRTFTICGMADSLSPEIVQGKGHGLPADWWALGVLIYFMLKGEMPFGSWRQSELDTYAKIAKGQITIPPTFSPEAADLITKLLEVDEDFRLGGLGSDSVKSHRWFEGVDWNGIRDGSSPVPHEITNRVTQSYEIHSEDFSDRLPSPSQDTNELDAPEWLDDW
ncbi:protein phosphatase 2C and cyclic nucleotide-binding/kinase domain-containing protein [Euphorbia lathyris]|uniref:protein phosphatase 2C and cyclic nucleotide-binding/kinase domain-containing protein n=1 Tax=Euphorbia lathyris TaxID=212925 RepID=UPI0033142AA1